MEAPDEMNGELVDCPSCQQPVLVTNPIVVDPPKPKERSQPRPSYIPQGRPPVTEHKRLEESAGSFTGWGLALLVVGVIISLVALSVEKDTDTLKGFYFASGCFSLGIVLGIVGQLVHIRAGIAEANYLKREEMRDRMVKQAVDKLNGI